MYPILIVPDRISLAEKSSVPLKSIGHQIDQARPAHGIDEQLRTNIKLTVVRLVLLIAR